MEEHIVLINYVNGDGYQAKEYCEIKEEIVRCRNCVHRRDDYTDWCELHGSPHIDNSGFCAWGDSND